MDSGAPELQKKSPQRSGRTLLAVLFVVYLVLLTWIVLWKLEVPWVGGGALRQIKLIPFAPSGEHGGSAPFEVIVNVVLFVPFGVYLGLLRRSWSWWMTTGVIAGASLTLEIAQYLLAVGGSDVTDLVVNTAGGLAGIGLFALARRRLRERTAPVMTRLCSIGTVLALLATGIFVASPLRYAQREAPLLSTHAVPLQHVGTASRVTALG